MYIVSYNRFIRGDTAEFTDIYIKPYTRCGSYFVGIFLGYILWRSNFKTTMHKAGVSFGWLISLAVICTVVYIPSTNSDVTPWTKWAQIVFLSIERPLVAAAFSWMVFACITGYGGK